MNNLRLAIEQYASGQATLGEESDGEDAALYFPFFYGWYLYGAPIHKEKAIL